MNSFKNNEMNLMKQKLKNSKLSIWEIIKLSLFKSDVPSSSRIFSYIMMFIILLVGLVFVVVEIVNAVIVWKRGEPYIPDWRNITIIGMWLAHQLTLLGIYKNAKINLPNTLPTDKIPTETDDFPKDEIIYDNGDYNNSDVKSDEILYDNGGNVDGVEQTETGNSKDCNVNVNINLKDNN